MRQGLALEFYFDQASEERITRSVPTVRGGESILDIGARPHISLARFPPPVEEQTLVDLAEKLAGIVPRFRLYLSAVAAFHGEEGAIYLAPSIVPELTTAHRLAHELIAQNHLPTDPLYQSERWVPHCTMLMGGPDQLIGSHVESLRKSEACGWVEIVSVGVIAFRPVIEVAQFGLGK